MKSYLLETVKTRKSVVVLSQDRIRRSVWLPKLVIFQVRTRLLSNNNVEGGVFARRGQFDKYSLRGLITVSWPCSQV